MGHIRHNTIVITADAERVQQLRDAVLGIARERQFEHLVSTIVGPGVNGYCSFFIGPDGSKEWWSTSDEGDAFRQAVVEHLEQARQGQLWCDWVEVQFGDDDRITRIVRDSDHPDGDLDAD